MVRVDAIGRERQAPANTAPQQPSMVDILAVLFMNSGRGDESFSNTGVVHLMFFV